MFKPIDCYTSSNWLIIVRRHTAGKVSINPQRITGRVVKCWGRLRLLPQTKDGQIAGVISDDDFSWLLLFLDRRPHEHSRASQHKRCVYVQNVRPSQAKDFLHLPIADRPIIQDA
jgi:hypothetical protein